MDMDFAVSRPLVRHLRLVSDSCPSTRTFDPCFLQTPPRGGSPCIITSPYLHQVGQRTFTSKLLNMPSTRLTRFAVDEDHYVFGWSGQLQSRWPSDNITTWRGDSRHRTNSGSPKHNRAIRFNAHNAIVLPNLPGLVQLHFKLTDPDLTCHRNIPPLRR